MKHSVRNFIEAEMLENYFFKLSSPSPAHRTTVPSTIFECLSGGSDDEFTTLTEQFILTGFLIFNT